MPSQIKAVEAERDALVAREQGPALLARLKGLGAQLAGVLWSEGLYRRFDNRRQLAAYCGLAATPWRSGGIEREQGISKAGNPRLRASVAELAWLWLTHQPDSALARWFHARTQNASKRVRRVTIVALAPKLAVALWKYLEHGEIPEGAVVKAA